MIVVRLVCQVCDKEITGRSGYLWVDTDKAITAHRAIKKFEWEHTVKDGPLAGGGFYSGGDLLAAANAHPDAPWRAHHLACDPELDAASYTITADQLTTLAELLEWNAHLHEKDWIEYTTWDMMLASATTATSRLVISEEFSASAGEN